MITKDDIFIYADCLEDFSDYIPIKCFNLLCFFRLKPKCVVLTKDNLEPITDVKYAIFSPHENKYYLRTFRNYDLNHFYFYRRDLTFSGESTEIENLRRYVYDGSVTILLNKSQFDEISDFLGRLYKYQFKGEGVVKYKHYISLLQQSIDLEDYRIYGKSLTGYKTVVHQYEMRIQAIWDEIYKLNQKL